MWFSHLKKHARLLTLSFVLLFCLVFQLMENTHKPPSKRSEKSIVDVKGVDFGPYYADLERRIRPNWSPNSTDRKKYVVVVVHITRDGYMKSLKLGDNSGSSSANAAALKAIKLSAPFAALPKDYPGRTVGLNIFFDKQFFRDGTHNMPDTTATYTTDNEAEEKAYLGTYITELQRQIRRNWSPPTMEHYKRAVLTFYISRDGHFHNLKLHESSDSELANEAALTAVKRSDPFSRLPSAFKGSDLPIEFIFKYPGFRDRKDDDSNSNVPEINEADVKARNDIYISDLEQSIRRNWHPLSKDQDKRVVIILYITVDGHLKGTRLVGDSFSPSADAAAIKAIRLTAPFKEFPPGPVFGASPLELTFDKQLIHGGPSGRRL